eukprot:TRINITY_DN9618_c0_g6_i1.p1 TRINITY_DN9618_c0_g6~~TRINITY_DN9618_c0_g6_i1.p1  ORF type:complete len:171 (-),score=21.05 TRINITY_DN9618_c0_g6_i1:143-655(-)
MIAIEWCTLAREHDLELPSAPKVIGLAHVAKRFGATSAAVLGGMGLSADVLSQEADAGLIDVTTGIHSYLKCNHHASADRVTGQTLRLRSAVASEPIDGCAAVYFGSKAVDERGLITDLKDIESKAEDACPYKEYMYGIPVGGRVETTESSHARPQRGHSMTMLCCCDIH